MKLRERTRTFTFPVFAGYEVHVVISSDLTSSRKRRDAVIGEAYQNECCVGGIHEAARDGSGKSWIFLPEECRKIGGSGSVAHECFHCVRRLMRWAGAELENEVVAYHLGFLVGNVDYMLKGKSGKVTTYEKVT